MANKIIHDLNIKITQLEIIRDRGYNLEALVPFPQEGEPIWFQLKEDRIMNPLFSKEPSHYVNFLERFNQRFMKNVGVSAPEYRLYNKNVNDVEKTMFVYYAHKEEGKKNIGKAAVVEFIDWVELVGCDETILIIDAPLTSPACREMSRLTNVVWQVFLDSELSYSPIKHVLYSRHEMVPFEEHAELLKNMRVTHLSRLPMILDSDAVVKYFGFPVGSIIRIYRDDSNVNVLTPISVNYRVVVRGGSGTCDSTTVEVDGQFKTIKKQQEQPDNDPFNVSSS